MDYDAQTTYGCGNCPIYYNTAIKAEGDDRIRSAHSINIGYSPACHNISSDGKALKNNFIELYDGVNISSYTNIRIDTNIFFNASNISNYKLYGVGRNAILVTSPLEDNEIIIENTSISNFFDGIVIWRNTQKSTLSKSILIAKNQLSSSALGNFVLGIGISDYTLSSSGSIQISGNNLIDVFKGIHINNVANSQFSIGSNTIHLKYSAFAPINIVGIELENCEGADVLGNCEILCTTPNIPSLIGADVAGISIYKSKGLSVSLNRILNTTRALTFDNDCSALPFKETSVISNHFHDSKIGLKMMNNAKIGIQGCSTNACHLVTENRWYGIFDAHTYVDQVSNVNSDSKFYVQANISNSGYLSVPIINLGFPILTNYTTGVSVSNGFEIPISWNPVNTNVLIEYDCGLARNAPSKIASSNSNDTTAISLAEKVLIANIADSIGLAGYETETQWQSRKYVMDKLCNNLGFIYLNDTLGDYYNSNANDNLGLLVRAGKAIKNGDVGLASTLNNVVSNINHIEINQKSINRLLLKQAQHIQFTFSDSTELISIAQQCKLQGGDAVLQARIVYCAYYNQFNSFTDNCSNGGARKKNITHNDIASRLLQLSISPNPASQLLEIHYLVELGLKTNLIIYNLEGKIIRIHPIDVTQNYIQIAIDKLYKGIYYCQIKNEQQQSAIQKLVVIN